MSTEKSRTKSNMQVQKTERVGLRLSPEMREQALETARREKRSLSNWIEKLIAEALEAAEKGKH